MRKSLVCLLVVMTLGFFTPTLQSQEGQKDLPFYLSGYYKSYTAAPDQPLNELFARLAAIKNQQAVLMEKKADLVASIKRQIAEQREVLEKAENKLKAQREAIAKAEKQLRQLNPEPQSPVVNKVRIVAPNPLPVPADKILSVIKTRPGANISPSDIEDDVRTIMKTFRFANVQAAKKNSETEGVTVYFIIKDPTIREAK